MTEAELNCAQKLNQTMLTFGDGKLTGKLSSESRDYQSHFKSNLADFAHQFNPQAIHSPSFGYKTNNNDNNFLFNEPSTTTRTQT